MTNQQEITSDELFGIAKKVNRELETLPLHTHSAIVNMITTGMQHRQLAMQAANQQEQMALKDRSLRIQETMQAAQQQRPPGPTEVQ